ncbi:hypothetical protein B0A48_18501 [Cryoendolithus antarcticus]|uniref:Dicer-like protein 2 n=1 Tax=Cryoendolithus antarcticus TaxID=1507870 RepID=A0A1V8S8U5_9PEZI|nr:hypothetical protein B0A48_18501 [Cryoendolithus antarcticus]
MDTGSGKTQVAMLRIQAELDRCAAEQRIWFLAPSVDLCIQQHDTLRQAMPAYKMRLLTGQDNVDKWSELRIWDAALNQARVVVSTHAVLADALRHGFVRLTSLALLIFDEAHHCIKKHPANIIMKNFYHELKATGANVPYILGLSASLVMSSNLSSVSKIEANLDSVSVTPRIQREDLMRHVFRPECRILRYGIDNVQDEPASKGLQALHRALIQHVSRSVAFAEPETSMRNEKGDVVQRTLKRFYELAMHIFVELGASAADFFIRETIVFLRTKSSSFQDLQLDLKDSIVDTLLAMFCNARIEQACQQEDVHFSKISAKVQCLLDYLLQNPGDEICGIVFVERRVVASVLSSLLNNHPAANGKLRCIPSVGGSSFSGRKFAITELVDCRPQKQALGTFRRGLANIIVATSVLEEGIDVQACNLVACFDVPANLKSYIQRRGRARHQHSRYGILLEVRADQSKVAKWKELEDELTALCQEEREQADVYRCIEAEDEAMDYVLRVESTGATLDADSTLQQLHHFCQRLLRDPYADPRPEFAFHEDENGLIRGSVTLPSSIPTHARYASSKRTWRTEKAAQKDAAFHAYLALFEAGLLNKHLLPICQEWNVNEGLEERAPPARLQIEILDPWDQATGEDWHKLEIQITPSDSLWFEHEPPIHVILNTHRQTSTPPTLKLYWDGQISFETRFGQSTPCRRPSLPTLRKMHSFTSELYRAPRSERHWQVDAELLTLFEPSKDESWSSDGVARPADQFCGKQLKTLLRVGTRDSAPYLFRQWAQHGGVVCKRLPKRRNFSIALQPKLGVEQVNTTATPSPAQQQRTETFALHDCTVDSVTVPWARVGLFMPDILQHIHDYTLVDELRAKLSCDVSLHNRDYIRSAVTAPSAQRSSNYQRLEFLGDCVLKYVTSCQLFNTHPNWPEGYLSQRRSLLICNATLACAAIRTGLGRYIICDPIDCRQWTLPSTTSTKHSRAVSSKTLADVVEALIGAAWLEAGTEAAIRCIGLFLPALPIPMLFHESTPTKGKCSGKRVQVEALIGHQFTNPDLLSQALTHPSYAHVSRTESYERLEYLGDAVLDMLVAEMLAAHIDKLTQGRMTQIKAALVNADLLGYFCFDLRFAGNHPAINTATGEVQETYERSLADYLAFHPDVASVHRDASARYYEFRRAAKQGLEHGVCHAWAELRQMGINKMFSDLVESILGAIFLDSGQEISACRPFAQRLGLYQYANRVIDKQVDVVAREALTESSHS